MAWAFKRWIEDRRAEMLGVAIDGLFAADAPPRLLVDGAGAIVAGNPAAAAIDQAALGRWAQTGFAGVHAIDVLGPQIPRRYQFQAVAARHQDADVWLLLGLAGDLNNHLVEALAASRALYKDLVQCAGAFAFECDADGCFRYVSGSEILGLSPTRMLGAKPAELFGLEPKIAAELFGARTPVTQADLWLPHGDGHRVCLQLSVLPVTDGAGNWLGVRGMGHAVTAERDQAEALETAHERLAVVARTDGLTGLYNRRAFDEALATRLSHARRTRRPGMLALIDLDHFKAVNDRFGHAAGDAVLQALGKGLTAAIRAGDIAARLGGDEFALWLEESDQAGAEAMAKRLLGLAPGLRAAAGDDQCKLSISIGIARSDLDEPKDALMLRADAALYRTKAAGRDGVTIAADFARGETKDV